TMVGVTEPLNHTSPALIVRLPKLGFPDGRINVPGPDLVKVLVGLKLAAPVIVVANWQSIPPPLVSDSRIIGSVMLALVRRKPPLKMTVPSPRLATESMLSVPEVRCVPPV